MVFPGYTVLYEEGKDTEDAEGKESGLLPELKEGQALDLLKLLPKQHFTQPPPRFTEATIIKELEERGIGRPSTYAAIISTILQREYVQLQKKKLHPTELGFMINDLLVQHFPDIMDVEFTANMEDNLDRVEQGEYASGRLLNEFYESFRKTLEAAQENMQSLKAEGLPTGLTCPQCEQGELVIKAGKNGPFIGCARYPECSFTTNYERDEKGGVVLLNGGKTEEESTGQKCPQCGEGELVVKTGRNGPFIACNNYPKCRFTSNFERKEDGSVHLVQDPPTGETCDKCGKPMVLKRGKKGPFLACSGYPKCKNTRPLGTGIPCPEEDCQGELVERSGKRGKPFWGCSRYPACKKVFWDRPVKEECPQCGSPFLLEKTDRKTGAVKLVCPHKDCGYSRRAEDAAGEGPGEAGKAAGRSG
jgi:DNA topoisomerase-1